MRSRRSWRRPRAGTSRPSPCFGSCSPATRRSGNYGDVAAQVERAWVTLAAGGDLHLRECLVRAAGGRRAVARPDAAPVERLLVERAVAHWLQLHYFGAVEAGAVAAGESPRLLQWRAERQALAQQMYESALAALVAVQKLPRRPRPG